MSAFDSDLAENMKNPEFAYNYGRTERELEIIKLLEPLFDTAENAETRRLLTMGIVLIKGEHRHSIYTQGVPCDYCGEFHERCNDCDWVEPCEAEGENK